VSFLGNPLWYDVLQCVAVVLQCVAVARHDCCSVLQCVAVQCDAVARHDSFVYVT